MGLLTATFAGVVPATGAAAAPPPPPTITFGAEQDVAGATGLRDIACMSAALCVAVGDGGGVGTVVAIRNGVADPAQPVAGTASLDGVDCYELDNCFAYGADSSGVPREVPIFDGVAAPSQASAGFGVLQCPGAVGICYGITGTNHTDVTKFVNGAVVGTSTAPGFSSLTAISCLDTTTCIVIGPNPVPPGQFVYTTAYAVVTNGVVGQARPIVANQDFLFDHVSCHAPNFCYVGGSYFGVEGVAVRIQVRAHRQSKVREDLTVGSLYLGDAECPLQRTCVMPGASSILLVSRKGYFRIDGGAALPAANETVDTVICPTTSTCYGIGDVYQPTTSSFVGLVQPFTLT